LIYTHGSSDSDQIAGRRELDEVPTVTAGSALEVDDDHTFEDDGPWYMGKARDEFNRRMRGAGVPGDDEDPIQVHNPSGLPFPD
jgi:SEL1 protein